MDTPHILSKYLLLLNALGGGKKGFNFLVSAPKVVFAKKAKDTVLFHFIVATVL